MPGEVLTQKFSVHLDWSAKKHWSDDAESCVSCGDTTHERDAQDRPIHQSCAEALLTEQAGPRGGLVVDERFLPQIPHEHTTEVTR